jgi:hypothetical protein
MSRQRKLSREAHSYFAECDYRRHEIAVWDGFFADLEARLRKYKVAQAAYEAAVRRLRAADTAGETDE